jgi:ADP-ribosylglycohydrolase
VADALGVSVEFREREELREAPVTDMMGYGTYPVPSGTWSDDTSMSLAALDSLADGKTDWFEIMVNFVKWLENGAYTATDEVFDVGGTCKRAILNFVGICCSEENGFVLPYGFDVTGCGLDGPYANGNGSLMRIHPFVLSAYFNQQSDADMEILMEKASSLTHAHGRSKLACKIYALILQALLDEPKKESVARALHTAKQRYADHPEYLHFARLFDKNFSKLSIAEIKSTGYVVDTLEAAVWCLLNTDSYQACVLAAVNLGEDTDTVAAVAGTLAGALYGYDSIPEAWLDTLKRRDYIEELCEEFAAAWGL